MSSNDIDNTVQSIKDRLSTIASREEISFARLLLLYLQERLIYRLSQSQYSSNFLLRGGMLMLAVFDHKTRPTKDIDFLGLEIPHELEEVKNIWREIGSIEVEDGVEFDPESITAGEITEGIKYEGVSTKIDAYLGDEKERLRMDVGFGDGIFPPPRELEYPVLLDSPAPVVSAYTLETVIAEKFETMIKLAVMNSRMKDFYDLYILSDKKEFDGATLQKAVNKTFERRGNSLEEDPIVFTRWFPKDRQKNKMWDAYMKKTPEEGISFEEVMDRIKVFLAPIYEASLKGEEFCGKWNKNEKKWEVIVH